MGTLTSKLVNGEKFKAKWSDTLIVVENALGEGANGTVYKVRTPLGLAAMKVCATSSDVALEWALLTSLGKGAQTFPKPMLIDDGPPSAPFFYVMEWIPGRSLAKVLQSGDYTLAMRAFPLVIQALVHLHQAGYAFCDLKPENVVVMTEGERLSVRFVDVGGVTKFGRSVRQYTPFCDRAFYGLGTRKAEATYDLFALVLGFITSDWQGQGNELAKREPEKRLKALQQACSQFPVSGLSLLFHQLSAGLVHNATDLLSIWEKLPWSAKDVHRKVAHGQHVPKWNWWKKKRFTKQNQFASGGRPQAVSAAASHVASSSTPRDWTEWLMWTSLCSAVVVGVVAWGILLGWLP